MSDLDAALDFLMEAANEVDEDEVKQATEEKVKVEEVKEKIEIQEEKDEKAEEEEDKASNELKNEVPQIDIENVTEILRNDIDKQLDKLSNELKEHQIAEDNDESDDLDDLNLDFTGRIPTSK